MRRELATRVIRVAPRLQGSLIYCIAARRLSPTVHRPAPRSAAARRSWAAAPGARCWSGRRQGWGTGSARGSAWRACPPVPFPALAPGHRILLRGTGGHPLTPPDLTPGRDQSATTGVMTRSFAGLAPPRTARSVTAGIASLAPTRCARTTWTPSSGARRLTWRRRRDREGSAAPAPRRFALAPALALLLLGHALRCSHAGLPLVPSVFLYPHRRTFWVVAERASVSGRLRVLAKLPGVCGVRSVRARVRDLTSPCCS